MPAKYGLRFDADHRIQQRREETTKPDQNQTIDVPQSDPLRRPAAQTQQLLAKNEELDFTRGTNLKQRTQHEQDPSQQSERWALQ